LNIIEVHIANGYQKSKPENPCVKRIFVARFQYWENKYSIFLENSISITFSPTSLNSVIFLLWNLQQILYVTIKLNILTSDRERFLHERLLKNKPQTMFRLAYLNTILIGHKLIFLKV